MTNLETTKLTTAPIFIATALICNLAQADPSLPTTRVATGLSRPVFVAAPPGDTERLFIAEQHTGRVKILNLATGAINSTPFLDVNGLSTGNEQGLLGLAFDPDYEINGHVYVNFTDNSNRTNVQRFTVSDDPDIADSSSGFNLLQFNQPQGNHNGGWIDFGPNDGMLYIASGDGGGGDDNDSGHTSGMGNGQDITSNLLGKILRIDVGGDDFPTDANRNYSIPASNPFVGVTGDDEIWAYGLRNPWRNSFDRVTGDLYIADVGQGRREEINLQPAGSAGGENYGWRLREGFIATPSGVGGALPPGAVDPIHDYPHDRTANGGFSVTGGYVYRGPIEPLQGSYFFADFVTDNIWSFEFDGNSVSGLTNRASQFDTDVGVIGDISSFGEDSVGNLYIVDLGGDIFRIVGFVDPDLLACDFDGDGVCDVSDIDLMFAEGDLSAGVAVPPGAATFDLNGDNLIDNVDVASWLDEAAAENGFAAPYRPGDANLDGVVDAVDLNALGLSWREEVRAWSAGDFDADGVVNAADLNALGVNWQTSLPPAAAATASVPEPSGFLFLSLLALGVYFWIRRGGSPSMPQTG